MIDSHRPDSNKPTHAANITPNVSKVAWSLVSLLPAWSPVTLLLTWDIYSNYCSVIYILLLFLHKLISFFLQSSQLPLK